MDSQEINVLEAIKESNVGWIQHSMLDLEQKENISVI